MDAIVAWALVRCAQLGREGLRLDTFGGNDALIAYYQSRGFTLVQKRMMGNDPRLSPHYKELLLALLERPLRPANPDAPFLSEPPGTEHTATGTVKWFRSDKGYGAVASNATAPFDVWFHYSSFEREAGAPFREIEAGTDVEVDFHRANQESFKYVADSVRRVKS